MDTLNNLLTAAAGYFGNEQKNQAQIELAKLGVQTTAAQATTAQVKQAEAAQIIPGVSNTTLFAVGAGLFALGMFAFLARRP